MKQILTRKALLELDESLGVRPDWHEPDEQEVTAHVVGAEFDNAGTPGEMTVVLRQNKKVVGEVNLASLFAWATGYRGDGGADPSFTTTAG